MTNEEQAVVNQMVGDIDSACAAIYAKYTRFGEEYKLRETQAQAFKDAGYAGEAPRQVRAFSERAAVPDQQATDLIISQADELRQLLETVGDTRMRKYEVLRALAFVDAQIAFAAVMQTLKTIEAQLP